MIQKGAVKAIEPNQLAGAILRIDHKPPLNLFFLSQKTLPVKVTAISHSLFEMNILTFIRNL